ncbi:aminopeptidase P family protein [Bombella sp. TMW 2.2559]|uniref:Aminopeptidase P family protein n=1 Tax=Bombella dulcis TaxID=2967339 RepID=A0ABT3WA95_9PROT|nr:aminopeptidase P family protein [Bombella dulcis]MCX5615728.1 aminopeptidase P family protein [Bombella dulcis]
MSLSSVPLEERPALVRQHFSRLSISGFIVTRGDEYLGEYVAPHAERLAWLTGFTGSAGLAILLEKEGSVFSDGRYTVQMAEQAPASLWETHHGGQIPPRQWLAQKAQGVRIGYDPKLTSQKEFLSWETAGVQLVPLDENPIDLAWPDQPAAPAGPIHHHPLKFTGETSRNKRDRLAQQLRDAGQDAMILADCPSLAWLLNIRGDDISMTPVAHAYGILHAGGTADIFADASRFLDAPEDTGIRPCPASSLITALNGFSGKTIRLDPATTPIWFRMILGRAGAHVVDGNDLCTLPKAIKSKVEQDGNRQAHRLDSIAMARFLHWLEQHGTGHHETELTARLEAFRALSPDYRGPSFETISAAGPNGAYPHYRAEKGRDSILQPNSVYLVDSGAQYPFGTTDITRTIWNGPDEAPAAIRQAFTAVLKGNITLSRQRFPKGLPGYRLDTLARSALWNLGLDFDHGTGHGIGSYLSVHEGPQSISVAPRPTGLVPGMILSNEPGYYEVGAYGIRIENLLLVRESSLKDSPCPCLEFEVLTHTPIDRKLINVNQLTTEERQWLDHYHATVLETLRPLLEEELHPWLERCCAPLS